MKPTKVHLIKKALFLGTFTTGLWFTSCNSTLQYIDTDGVYNDKKQYPVETHFNKDYYAKYFEEKNIDAEHFTNIDDYSSLQNGLAPWGEDVSKTVIINHAPFYNHFAFYPNWHYNWGWHSSFWGWNYGWGSDFYPYYGYNYGWGGWYYPIYGYYNNNVSYASTRQTVAPRNTTPTAERTITRGTHRNLNNSTLANTRNISTARRQTRVTDYSNSRRDTRTSNTIIRSNESRNYNTERTSTPPSRTSSGSNISRSSGGSMGSSRSVSGGGRR